MLLSTLKLFCAAVVIPLTLWGNGAEVDDRAEYFCDESYMEESVVEEAPQTEEESVQLYSVNGEVLDKNLQTYLYNSLASKGIEWWFTYALCQMYQESRFNLYAINQQNHEDMGLFQYKNRFWAATASRYGRPGADIFDPYAQIDVYSAQIRDRLERNGWNNEKTISDHYTGEYGYFPYYVQEVLKWAHTINLVR